MELFSEAGEYRQSQSFRDLNVVGPLMGMLADFKNYCWFIYYYCSQAVSKHYKQKWGGSHTSVPGNMSKGLLSTLHIKLE